MDGRVEIGVVANAHRKEQLDLALRDDDLRRPAFGRAVSLLQDLRQRRAQRTGDVTPFRHQPVQRIVDGEAAGVAGSGQQPGARTGREIEHAITDRYSDAWRALRPFATEHTEGEILNREI